MPRKVLYTCDKCGYESSRDYEFKELELNTLNGRNYYLCTQNKYVDSSSDMPLDKIGCFQKFIGWLNQEEEE